MNLPYDFTQRMSALLPDAQDFFASCGASPVTGLRANTLKLMPARLNALVPGLHGCIDWCAEGFYTDPHARPGKSPCYHAGLYYIQEPSAMSPAAVMDVRPGHRVLDLCAAPGGKSTQLAAKLCGRGVLVANDVSAARARALLKNIELCGAVNCVVTNEPPARLAARFAACFDRILVDAPCSGEGMFRRDPDACKAWAARKPGACLALQRETLHYAAMMLRPGGRLMYSTCTFAPDENELMIAEFLSRQPAFAGVPIAHAELGLAPGLYGEAHTARIWPHRQRGEGHFLAYLQKSGADDAPEYHASRARGPLPREFAAFCESILHFVPEAVVRRGDSLFIPPQCDLPDLKGLRVIRAGLYLGDLPTKRFEPSQAFAMALRAQDVKRRVDFTLSDESLALRYLKGESFALEDVCPADLQDGWRLMTLEGFPLGWAKAAGGRLKNKYPKGWLMNG